MRWSAKASDSIHIRLKAKKSEKGKMMISDMLEKIATGQGFIAALDQSGGSTPKALEQYGIDETAYTNDAEMFALVHEMRKRIITAPAFSGDKIIGAILFEKTMDSEIEGMATAQYLWTKKAIVPFLKVDKGLEETQNGVQLMKPVPGLDTLLVRAKDKGIFGTKMRSVIHEANETAIREVVRQQFEIGKQILSHGLMPIIEPEISIKSATKQACEDMMRDAILDELSALPEGQQIMLKLTLPEETNFYLPLCEHTRVLRVVALSGGYDLEQACRRLAGNKNMIASFSRALANDLKANQSEDDFNAVLGAAIDKIYQASIS